MEQIESFIKNWPRAVLCMLAGALIGWIAWMFLPQDYTAVAGLSIIVDYNHTGKLTDLEEDQIVGITEDILHSREIMETVFQASSESDYDRFFNRTRITRTNSSWNLVLTGEDPEEIGKLALLWRDSAYDMLSDSLDHAVRADAFYNVLEGLTRCIRDSKAIPAADCPTDPEEITAGIDAAAKQLREEKAAARGLSSAVILGAKDSGSLQIRPASRSAAADTFLGALCGLAAAFALVWFPTNRKQE